MQWYDEAVAKLCKGKETHRCWKDFADKINTKEPSQSYRVLNEHLTSKTFLLGNRLTSDDLYLAQKLMQCPTFSKMLTSKTRPFHLCRWFTQVFSLHPDTSYEFYRLTKEKIDNRLIQSLKEANMKKFKNLLEFVDVNAKYEGDLEPRPIHIACKLGNKEALELLLKSGASIETQNAEGLTPIFFAVHKNQHEIFNYLLELGANIHHRECQNRSLFYWAASSGNLEFVKILYEKGCDPNEPTLLGRTALSKAAWNGTPQTMKYLLSLPTIDIDKQDNRGRTALHNAVWGCAGGRLGKKMGNNSADSPECALMLIEKGASLEIPDNSGNTPVCIASSTCAVSSLKLLIEKGANVSHTNHEGDSPLHQAVGRGHSECVEILLSQGVDINAAASTPDTTPLRYSIKHLKPACLKFLIEKGAFADSEDLKYACEHGNKETLELVIQKTGFVREALLHSLEKGNQECTELMLNKVQEVTQEELVAGIRRKGTIYGLVIQKYTQKLPEVALETAILDDLDINYFLENCQVSGRSLHAAIKKNKENLAVELVNHKPELWRYLDPLTERSALHLSCIQGFSKLASVLVQVSSDPCDYMSWLDYKGLDPVLVAEIHKHHYLSELLRDLYSQATDKELISHVRHIEYEESAEAVPVHPYELEQMPRGYLEVTVATKPIEETGLLWVDSYEALEEMKRDLEEVEVVGVDLEYHSFSETKGCVCLLQISSGAKDYLLDTLQIRKELRVFLQELMLDDSVVKIFHGGDSDVLWLQNDFDAHVVRMFDTARAHKILFKDSFLPSLANLLKTCMELKIDKTFQIADWRIRPLPLAMLNYARTDAHYLPDLYNYFTERMSHEQLDLLSQVCNSMCHKHPFPKLTKLNISC